MNRHLRQQILLITYLVALSLSSAAEAPSATASATPLNETTTSTVPDEAANAAAADKNSTHLGSALNFRDSEDTPPPRSEELPPEFSIQSGKDRKDLDYFLLQMSDRSTKESLRWWAEYQRAFLWQNEDPELACTKWQTLANDEKFPARQIAAVRTIGVCPVPHEFSMLVPGWLEPLKQDQLLVKHRREKNTPEIVRSLIEISKRSLPLVSKAALAQEAANLAKTLRPSKDHKKLKAEAQDRLFKLSPRLNPQPKSHEYLAVALDLRRARQFKQAEHYYEKILKLNSSSPQLKLKALYGIAACHKNGRDHEAYTKHLARVERFALNEFKRAKRKTDKRLWTNKYVEASIDLARAEWTLGHRERGMKVLEKLTQKLRQKTNLSLAYWIMGRMEDEAGSAVKANEFYKLALDEKDISKLETDRVLWALAWNLRKSGNRSLALEYLDRGVSEAATEFSLYRFRFWKAITLKNLDQKDMAKREFESLVSEDPLGYYGIMAQRELGQKLHLPEPSGDPISQSKLGEYIPQVTFDWLISLGENSSAIELLDDSTVLVRRAERKLGGDFSGTWTELFRKFGRAGHYLKLFEHMGRIDANQRAHILSHHPDLLFPEPYPEIINQAAESAQIEPELILSIIRQESSFNPFARSPADAFGLMQLLPEVAEQNASVAKVAFERPEDLYQPEVNIPLGAHFLRELGVKFRGQFIPMVASYNASQSAIRRWIDNHYSGDVLEFIEDIPYEETRGYVRLVLRNLVFYKLLRDKRRSIQFPEWTLKLEREKESARADESLKRKVSSQNDSATKKTKAKGLQSKESKAP